MASHGSYKYIYVATCSCGVKVGITSDVKRRLRGLSHGFFPPTGLVRSWRHAKPEIIERFVQHELFEFRVHGREWFSVDAATAVRSVCKAMRHYKEGHMPRSPGAFASLRRRARKKVATLDPELSGASSRTLYDILDVRRPNDPGAGGRGKTRGSK